MESPQLGRLFGGQPMESRLARLTKDIGDPALPEARVLFLSRKQFSLHRGTCGLSARTRIEGLRSRPMGLRADSTLREQPPMFCQLASPPVRVVTLRDKPKGGGSIS